MRKLLLFLYLIILPTGLYAETISHGCHTDQGEQDYSVCEKSLTIMHHPVFTPQYTVVSTPMGQVIPVTPDPSQEAREKQIALLIEQNKRLLEILGSGSVNTGAMVNSGALTPLESLRARFYKNQSARLEAHKAKMQAIRARYLELQSRGL